MQRGQGERSVDVQIYKDFVFRPDLSLWEPIRQFVFWFTCRVRELPNKQSPL